MSDCRECDVCGGCEREEDVSSLGKKMYNEVKVGITSLGGVHINFGPEGDELATEVLLDLAEMAGLDEDVDAREKFLELAKTLEKRISSGTA